MASASRHSSFVAQCPLPRRTRQSHAITWSQPLKMPRMANRMVVELVLSGMISRT